MDQVGAHAVRSGAEIVKEESLLSSSNRGEEKHSSKEIEYSRKVYCREIRRTMWREYCMYAGNRRKRRAIRISEIKSQK